MNKFFIRTTNYFFSGIANYFYRKYWELFFHCADNYFSRYIEFIFWPTIHCGLVIDGDWVEFLYNGAAVIPDF